MAPQLERAVALEARKRVHHPAPDPIRVRRRPDKALRVGDGGRRGGRALLMHGVVLGVGRVGVVVVLGHGCGIVRGHVGVDGGGVGVVVVGRVGVGDVGEVMLLRGELLRRGLGVVGARPLLRRGGGHRDVAPLLIRRSRVAAVEVGGRGVRPRGGRDGALRYGRVHCPGVVVVDVVVVNIVGGGAGRGDLGGVVLRDLTLLVVVVLSGPRAFQRAGLRRDGDR
mmetsp:Transcript_11824/g.31262  ORF Transcript_11824/g.31262 Transcript_11824/m.31262 type:complete len:224 (-) Transcript_11824:180-851(-)